MFFSKISFSLHVLLSSFLLCFRTATDAALINFSFKFHGIPLFLCLIIMASCFKYHHHLNVQFVPPPYHTECVAQVADFGYTFQHCIRFFLLNLWQIDWIFNRQVSSWDDQKEKGAFAGKIWTFNSNFYTKSFPRILIKCNYWCICFTRLDTDLNFKLNGSWMNDELVIINQITSKIKLSNVHCKSM